MFPVLFLSLANAESPLQFYVNYPNSGSVSAYGPGLVYGVANKTATFTIVTEDAGEGTAWFTCLCICSLPFGEVMTMTDMCWAWWHTWSPRYSVG